MYVFKAGSGNTGGSLLLTEIIIELTGEDQEGKPLRTRHAVVHTQGQMPLTTFGTALLLEWLIGLDNGPKVPAGLYFPYQLLDHATYFARLKQAGGVVLKLE